MTNSTIRNLARAIFVLVLSCTLRGQTDAALFDNTTLQELRLTVVPATWQTLRDNYAYDDYYSADFAWNGTSFKNIGIRSRGSGSRSPKKPNLLVKFNKYVKGQKLLGHGTIVLKANNQDGSMIREFLTFRLMEKMGLPAPRESFARMYVNGEYFGLYTIVEYPDEDYIGRLYGESTGFLYEFNPILGYDFHYLGDSVDAYSEMFEAKTNDKAPELEKIVAMMAAINQTPDPDFQAVAQSYVDLQGFMSLLAVQNYVADEDGILSDVFTLNNFYLYRAAAGKQFRFLPWDEDFSMLWSGRRVEQNLNTTVLSRRTYALPELRQLYLDTIIQTSSVAGAEDGWLRSELERVYAMIAPSARLDPNKQCVVGGAAMRDCNAEDFESQVNEVRTFIAERYDNARDQIAAMPGSGTAQMSEGGIVNAASNRDGLVPGSLVSIYGSSMARTGAVADAIPLPRILADAEVKVNGVSAPLLFASPLQINFQVPWSTNVGDATVELSVAGVRKDIQRIEIQRATAGIFVATHADYTPIDAAHPVKAGEIVIVFATGLGPVSVPVLDGQPAPLDRLSWTTDPVSVTIDGADAQVLFSGLAPGMVGVYQLNVVMPGSWLNPGGFVNLAIRVGQSDSPETTLPKQ